MTTNKNRIYTRTGDRGSTSLFGGERVGKDDQRIDSIGSLDELNASLGLARDFNQDLKVAKLLQKIQNEIFNIGAELANPEKVGKGVGKALVLAKSRVGYLEKAIDGFDKQLPALRSFILPGGTKLASCLHLSRGICRRSEREVVKLAKKGPVNQNILFYLNRLSDLLFVLARYANKESNKTDIPWKKN